MSSLLAAFVVVARSPESQEPQGCRSQDTRGFCSPRRSWVLGGCPATSQWDVLPPSHALSEVHLIFFILWASIQLCCCFHWGAEWFLFLSPGGLYQWGKHFVLGTTERKMNVSALVHYSFRNKSLKCLFFVFFISTLQDVFISIFFAL